MDIIIDTKIDQPFKDLVTELYTDRIHLQTKSVESDDYLIYTVKAFEKGLLRGRLAIYENPYLHNGTTKTWVFGLYECIQNATISKAMFVAMEHLARERQVTRILGPMNGSTWYSYRQGLSNDRIFLSEEATKPYYTDHFKKAGFTSFANYCSAIDTTLDSKRDVSRVRNKLINKGVHIRTIKISEFEQEVANLYALVMDAFKDNLLFSPISKEMFIQKYVAVKSIIDPKFFLIAEDANGKPIGFLLAFPDAYNTSQKSIIVKTLARDPSPKWAGLGSLMIEIFMGIMVEEPVDSVVHAFIYEDNSSKKISNHYGIPHKKYYLYEKYI